MMASGANVLHLGLVSPAARRAGGSASSLVPRRATLSDLSSDRASRCGLFSKVTWLQCGWDPHVR